MDFISFYGPLPCISFAAAPTSDDQLIAPNSVGFAPDIPIHNPTLRTNLSGFTWLGCCSRCDELGLPSVASRWQFVDDKKRCIRPKYVFNTIGDLGVITQRFIHDRVPLVDICAYCVEAKYWTSVVCMDLQTAKSRPVLRFGHCPTVMIPSHAEHNLQSSRDSSKVTMSSVPQVQTPDLQPLPPSGRRTRTRRFVDQISASQLSNSPELPTTWLVGTQPDYYRIRRWLKACCSSHALCKPKQSESLAKIRVVDVRRRSIVRLPTRGQYLTLSYVWGRTVQPKLPIATLELPVQLPARLPKTIEDAIMVTRKLGFVYLWVDCICIDQSNAEDKATQIGFMDRIYHGAYATIVALNSSHANSGLSRVRAKPNAAKQVPLYYQGACKYLSLLPTLREELDRSSWMKRGWTYQEGLLSHRTIYFGRHQVYFTCNHTSVSEDRGVTSSSLLRSKDEFTMLLGEDYEHQALRNPLDCSNQVTLRSRPLSIFNLMMKDYNRRELTDKRDTLDAVSGALNLMQKTFCPQGFLYGLPLDFFRSALSWAHDPTKYIHRLGINDFPSWSWAAWYHASSMYITAAEEFYCSILQPPLKICHGIDWIDCNKILSSTKREDKMLYHDLESLQSFYNSISENPCTLDTPKCLTSRPGILYVEGIVIKLPCTKVQQYTKSYGTRREPTLRLADQNQNNDRREQTFSISQEALILSTKETVEYDFLLVSTQTMKINSVNARLMPLRLLMLTWDNQGIAQRIGVAEIMFAEYELLRVCTENKAQYLRFWLG